MSDGQVWQVAEGKWRGRYRTPDGRRPQETFRTRKAAEKWLRDRIDEAELGIGHVERHATWRDFYPLWEAATRPSVSSRTWERYESDWRVWLAPHVGGQRISEVNTARVQRLIDEVTREGRAPKTAEMIVATWRSMIGMAAAEGRCRPLPRDRGSKPRMPKRRVRPITVPTPAEVVRIADAHIEPLRAFVLVCGFCCLRQGEALALWRENIDWKRGRVWVGWHMNKVSGAREAGTKEDSGAWVPMPPLVRDALREHIDEFSTDWVFPRLDAVDAPYTHSMVYKAWTAACARAGVRGVRPHDLRHAGASAAIASGMNVRQLAEFVRHADPAFTLKVYGHLFPADTAAAIDRLDEYLMGQVRAEKGRIVDAVSAQGGQIVTP